MAYLGLLIGALIGLVVAFPALLAGAVFAWFLVGGNPKSSFAEITAVSTGVSVVAAWMASMYAGWRYGDKYGEKLESRRGQAISPPAPSSQALPVIALAMALILFGTRLWLSRTHDRCSNELHEITAVEGRVRPDLSGLDLAFTTEGKADAVHEMRLKLAGEASGHDLYEWQGRVILKKGRNRPDFFLPLAALRKKYPGIEISMSPFPEGSNARAMLLSVEMRPLVPDMSGLPAALWCSLPGSQGFAFDKIRASYEQRLPEAQYRILPAASRSPSSGP